MAAVNAGDDDEDSEDDEEMRFDDETFVNRDTLSVDSCRRL